MSVSSLGLIDARSVTGVNGNLEGSLYKFYFKCNVFLFNIGIDRYRPRLQDFMLTIAALLEELDEPWNSRLSCRLAENTGQTSSNCATSNVGYCVGSQSSGSRDKLPDYCGDDQINRTSEKRTVFFLPPSPVKYESLPTFECDVCGKKYGWLKVLKIHVRRKHPEANIPEGREREDRVRCLMCNSVSERSLLNRHLKRVHNVDRDSEGRVFRGFKSADNGATWEPLFLFKGEPDPPPEFLDDASEDDAMDVVGDVDADGCEEDVLDDIGEVDNIENDENTETISDRYQEHVDVFKENSSPEVNEAMLDADGFAINSGCDENYNSIDGNGNGVEISPRGHTTDNMDREFDGSQNIDNGSKKDPHFSENASAAGFIQFIQQKELGRINERISIENDAIIDDVDYDNADNRDDENSDNDDSDSDRDSNDEEEFTLLRLGNKKVRYKNLQ